MRRKVPHSLLHRKLFGLKFGGRICYFLEGGQWIRVDKKATREWKRKNAS